MKTGLRLCITSATLACAIALAGCGATPPKEPVPSDSGGAPEAVDLLGEIKAADYTGWTPAPGYESRVAAKGPHGDEVQILLGPTAEAGLADGGDRWPLDSIIAKDIFRNGEHVQIAAMKKTADGWYWGEWDAQGNPIVEGVGVQPCEGCHADGTDGTLGIVLK